MSNDLVITNLKKLLIPCLIAIAVIMAITNSHQASTGVTDISSAKLIERSLTAIQNNYFDSERIDTRKMLKGALNNVERMVPEIIVNDDEAGHLSVVVGLATKRFSTVNLQTISELKEVLRQIFNFITSNYHGETKPEEIEYAAIDGMLLVLDPHSSFMSPKVYKEFKVGTRGKFGGLGIVISIRDGQLTVIAPIEETPAARAGIRAGDHILQIDDESTINMSLTDAVNKLRGDVGSKVSIVVERPGKPPRKAVLIRALINIESVKYKMLEENGKNIGYIKVKNFQANTDEDIGQALKEFHTNNAKLDGLILDLRNNPGGLLNVSVDIADRFLKSGVIVTTVGPRDKILEKEVAHETSSETGYPLIVLINEGSASASEIVAGALKSNNRAVIMGRRSFGKGSVQTLFELGEGSAIKLTIAQYKPAGTQNIQLEGVPPDIELLPVTVDRKSINLIEDTFPSEADLEEHLEKGLSAKLPMSSKPAYKVDFLKPPEDEKDLDKLSAKEYSKTLEEIDTDFAVKLARKLLASTAYSTRSDMLANISEPIKLAVAEQQAEIDASMKGLGIDWTDKKGKGDPKLLLSYKIKSPSRGEIFRAKAGEKIDVVFTATDEGTGHYVRLIAIGQSDMQFLSNREFPFGLIEPKGSRSWSVPIEIPEGLPTQDLLMDVEFAEGEGHPPSPLTIAIPVEELPHPAFSMNLNIPKNLIGKPVTPGTPVPVSVTVTNTGKGASSAETVAMLSNECGEKVFIEKGRTKIGLLGPKAQSKINFKFHLVKENSGEPECSLKLMIADVKRNIVLTKKITVNTEKNIISGVDANALYEAPQITVLKMPAVTAGTSAAISGVIKDKSTIKDYFVFVNEKKVAYVPNPKEGQEMAFENTVPLEPGNNYILIGARNSSDITGRKIVVINRTSGERKKNFKQRTPVIE